VSVPYMMIARYGQHSLIIYDLLFLLQGVTGLTGGIPTEFGLLGTLELASN
jgi:hypothetical protein